MKYSITAFLLSLMLILGFTSLVPRAKAQTVAEKQAELQRQLAEIEAEQAETEKVLASAQAQSASLKRDILILDTKIKAAQLDIQAKNLTIQTLGKDINAKEQTISNLNDQIDAGRDSLAQILRKTNEVDTLSVPEMILSGNTLSDTLADLDTFGSLELALKNTFEQIRSNKAETETEKDTLDKRRNAEIDARAAIQTQQKNIAADQAQKQRLLTISKGNEKTYSAVLADKQKQAAQIRAALFALAGGGQSIPFGQALGYANEISKKTGVAPAFLLAILTQESNLGSNVGKCYLTDPNTGSGINPSSGKTWPNVMKYPRDVVPFLSITQALGLNPTQTFVSCPIAGAGGYGGAMGPAQFIASTWMLFNDRIESTLGIAVANPWSPRDAFTASALYLSDLGAVGNSYSAQIRAACKYYGSGGSTCSYGRSVMSIADNIQRTMIDPLNGV